ncbi:MAG TPA: hypothetical protein VN933_03240, partial [Candidatus Eremiobacteraceae bacterium]|nr:hypothetical protein [Candidatus Eremiobacteraceae bacterium]
SLYAAGGRYYDLYTKQHAIQENLFLAPGEGDPEPLDINGEKAASSGQGRNGNAAPDPIKLIQGQG